MVLLWVLFLQLPLVQMVLWPPHQVSSPILPDNQLLLDMLAGFSAAHTLNPGIMDAFANSNVLQIIVKQRLVSTLRLQSGKADNARLHTGDKVIREACGSLCKSLKIYKRAKKQQPFTSTNCYTLAIHRELKDQCEGC